MLEQKNCGHRRHHNRSAEMNILELQEALEHAREQLFQAEIKLDHTTDKELIDAAIYEQKSWEERYNFYLRKLREAFKKATTCGGG